MVNSTAMAGFKRKVSGPNIPLSQRGTVVVQVRCEEALRDRVRAFLAAHDHITLADVLEYGVAALEEDLNAR